MIEDVLLRDMKMNENAQGRPHLKPISASQKVRMECLMAELIENTEWIEGNHYMFEEKVIFEIYPFDGRIHLASIESSVERGKGHASRALDWLLDLAAKHGVAIGATIQGLAEGGLTHAELSSWFARRGFKVLENMKMLYMPPSADR